MDKELHLGNYMDLNRDKFYFCSFLNMARHNAYITLAHISGILGNDNVNEGNLSQSYAVTVLKRTNRADQGLKSAKLLEKHFPFIRFMYDRFQRNAGKAVKSDEQPDLVVYHKIFTRLFKALNNQRNYYTHILHSLPPVEPELADDLIEVFDAAVRRVKERFELDEAQVKHLRRYCVENVHGKRNPKLNPAFKYAVCNESEFSQNGLAFFICLFLDKHYAHFLLKKLKDFKGGQTPAHRVTIEVFTVSRMRLPKQRLESPSTPLGLAMDMLNELKRCPDELFNLLEKEMAQKFRVADDVDEAGETDDPVGMPLQKRFGDRFPYFALRFIDTSSLFKQLRFHVDMGDYYYKFYSKQLIDGELRHRSLKCNLYAFGRIDELIEMKKEKWKDQIVCNPQEGYDRPYVTDTMPHYHIVDHQIGIKHSQQGFVFPLLTEGGAETQAPDFWLSSYELPGMLFYALLTKTTMGISKAETLILNHRSKVHRLFKDIAARNISPFPSRIQAQEEIQQKYELDINDLPEAIQRYLSSRSEVQDVFLNHAENRTRILISQTENLFRKISEKEQRRKDSKQNKAGKRRWVDIKSGNLAAFLAKDMLYLQPSLARDAQGKRTGCDKATSMNVQVLQAHLAYYGRDRLALKSIFKACGLIESHNSHPFLAEVDPEKCFTIVAFYKAYLAQRKAYFVHCQSEKKFEEYYYLKADRRKWEERNPDFYRRLAEDYLTKPINLPRGLFKDALVGWLKENGSDAMKNVLNNHSSVNAVFLIGKYLETEMNDSFQEFYNYPRKYKIVNRLTDLKTAERKTDDLACTPDQLADMQKNLSVLVRKLPSEQKTADKGQTALCREQALKMFNNFKDNEKRLRLIKVQDALLLLMVKELLAEHFDKAAVGFDTQTIKLSGIGPDRPESLSQQIRAQAQVVFENLTTRVKWGVSVFQDKLKIKNYGDFIRLVRDRRLQGLSSWLENDRIESSVLRQEFEQYDRLRIEVFAAIHRFEQAVYKRFPSEIEALTIQEDNMTYVDFKGITKVFFTHYASLMSGKAFIEAIRNKLSHNEYPEYNPEWFPDTDIRPKTLPGPAKYIRDLALRLLDNYIAELKK